LWAIRVIVTETLPDLGPAFESAYSNIARPSIPPERLLWALLLLLFHGIRSERRTMELLDFDLSFHWFVRICIDDPV
jgi:transposase